MVTCRPNSTLALQGFTFSIDLIIVLEISSIASVTSSKFGKWSEIAMSSSSLSLVTWTCTILPFAICTGMISVLDSNAPPYLHQSPSFIGILATRQFEENGSSARRHWVVLVLHQPNEHRRKHADQPTSRYLPALAPT